MATMMITAQRELRDYISEISEHAGVPRGSPLSFGAQESGGGVNFAIFSRNASRVRLELFDHAEDAAPAWIIGLDSAHNRTVDVWHVWVEAIGPGQLYAYRVDRPYKRAEGHRFNFNRLLLDPFATAISPLPAWDFASARGFDLPPGARWHLAVDTSREAPQDLSAAGEEPLWEDPRTYHLSPRSSAILLARRTEAK
jgi:isoamylase